MLDDAVAAGLTGYSFLRSRVACNCSGLCTPRLGGKASSYIYSSNIMRQERSSAAERHQDACAPPTSKTQINSRSSGLLSAPQTLHRFGSSGPFFMPVTGLAGFQSPVTTESEHSGSVLGRTRGKMSINLSAAKKGEIMYAENYLCFFLAWILGLTIIMQEWVTGMYLN